MQLLNDQKDSLNDLSDTNLQKVYTIVNIIEEKFELLRSGMFKINTDNKVIDREAATDALQYLQRQCLVVINKITYDADPESQTTFSLQLNIKGFLKYKEEVKNCYDKHRFFTSPRPAKFNYK